MLYMGSAAYDKGRWCLLFEGHTITQRTRLAFTGLLQAEELKSEQDANKSIVHPTHLDSCY